MFTDNNKITPVLGYFAAGVTKRTSTIIDMDGFDGVVFAALLGTTIEAGTVDVFVEQHTLNQTSGMARVATTTVYTVPASPAALTSIHVDVYKPRERYLQANITPAAQNAVVCGMYAIQYKGHVCPCIDPLTVVKVTKLISPAEA
jgi:hypothetical protein